MSKLVTKSVEGPKKTLEQELEELENKEVLLKEDLKKPDTLLREAYFSDSPKKNLIVKWAENLEERHDLEIELHRSLTVKTVGGISSYIKSELKKMGVPSSTLSYVHESLGHKYKYEKYDSSEKDESEGDAEQRLNSSNLIANYSKENTSLLETIHQQIEFLKNFRNKAKSSRILSALSPAELLQYEETNLRIQASQLFAGQIIDDRQSVPILAQLKLVMAIVASTNNFAAGQYVSQVKQYGANKMIDSQAFFEKTAKEAFDNLPKKTQDQMKVALKNIEIMRKSVQKMEEKSKSKKRPVMNFEDVMTPKQAMKIVFGLVKNVLSVFDHKDRDPAILDGYYGLMCPECGSFRVREKEHPDSGEWLCFCYSCEWWFESKTVVKCGMCHLPFFEEILEIILAKSTPMLDKERNELPAKESKCPRCDNPLILPAKMFMKPKLRGK